MVQHPANIYGSEGSVPFDPSVAPTGGTDAQMREHADPAEMGAAIGQGVSKVGEAATNLATQYGNIVNENLMTKADVDFSTRLGQLKADLTSKTGMAAYNAYPQYQADVAQAFQDSRANLPLGAQHGFDMLGARTMANHIADASSFAAGQLKEARRSEGADLTNSNIQAILQLSPEAAADKNRVDEHTGHAFYGLQMGMDENHPGLKTDPNTGEVSFDESTPAGQGLKTEYEANKDNIVTRIQSNRFDVLSKSDPLGAYNIYLNERADMPKQTQVTLDNKFEPIVFNAHVNNATGHAVAQSQDDYSRILYNPQSTENQSLAARNNNPGDLKDSATGQFRVFNTPEEGATAMTSDLTAKISGNSPAMEKNFGKGYSPTLSNVITTYAPASENNTKSYIDTVSKETGFPPDHVLTGADVPKLQAAMTKVEAGGSGNAISSPQKSYATNPDGSMFTTADYYRTHSADVLAHGDAYAQATMPDDLAFKRSVRETLTNYMAKVQANQSAQYITDNKNVMRGITGELTNGKSPETEQELRAIPGMNDLLNRVSAQDPRFSETIPRKIAEIAKQNTATNSSNGYDTILRTLQPQDDDHPNHIRGQNQLDSLLGKSDGTGINAKDYKDAKPATDLPPDSPVKDYLFKNMQQVANANGNIDGKGQQRAIAWYNQTMAAYKQNENKGDSKLSDDDFVSQLNERTNPSPPSRMQQIENWATSLFKGKQQAQAATVRVTSPDGKTIGTIPAAQLSDALKSGYKQVQ